MKNILFCFILFLFLACSSTSKVKVVSYDHIVEKQGLVIDVREENEIKLGMVKDALWIPLSKMKSNPKEVSQEITMKSQGRPVFIYCRSGKRASQFIELIEGSKKNVTNIGGFDSLVKAGFKTTP